MLRRFVTLLCVAACSGLAGTVLGVLIAPAPGHETQARMSGFVEEHGDLVTAAVEQGRQLAGAVVDFLTEHAASRDDT